MRGTLFDDLTVDIADAALTCGGSWQDGNGYAWGGDMIRRVYNALRERKNAVLVDVGASTGSFALLPVHLPDLRALAFEPAGRAFALLSENLQRNRIANRVRAYRVALSDVDGTAVLRVPNESNASGLATMGKHPLRFVGWSEEIVPTMRFDSIYRLDRVDVMKLDTEGAELFVLRGAEGTIRRCRPMLLIEYQPINTRQFGYEPEMISRLVEQFGYRCERVGEEDIWCTPI